MFGSVLAELLFCVESLVAGKDGKADIWDGTAVQAPARPVQEDGPLCSTAAGDAENLGQGA